MSKLQTQDKPADFEGIARISQVSGLGMLTLRGDFSDKKFQTRLKNATRLSPPGTRPRAALVADASTLGLVPRTALDRVVA